MPGLGVHRANRTDGKQGQYSGNSRSDLAVGEDPVPQLAGRLHGNDSRASERNDLNSLRTACGGTLLGRRKALGAASKTRGKGGKDGLGEAVENLNRFPTAPTVPWESRKT